MQRVAEETGSLVDTPAPAEENRNWEARNPSGPSIRPWSDWEVRAFLQEWERVEQEAGLPRRELHKKTRAVSQRLYRQGLKKCWKSCLQLLLSLQDLYRTLCNKRPRSKRLFSPYGDALHRILGYRRQHRHIAGPLCNGATRPQPVLYTQHLEFLPCPVYLQIPSVYQHQDCAIPTVKLHLLPSSITMVQDHLKQEPSSASDTPGSCHIPTRLQPPSAAFNL